jgi:hypothetical protein
MAGGTGTNILANLQLQVEQILTVMKGDLLNNNYTDLNSQYSNLITALQNDQTTVTNTYNATGKINTLTQ